VSVAVVVAVVVVLGLFSGFSTTAVSVVQDLPHYYRDVPYWL